MDSVINKLNETDEIWEFMQKHHSFIGCFPSDKIPPISAFPATMIINTADSSSAGEHWVACYMDEELCLYFDSFGFPVLEKDIQDYLSQYFSNYIFNKIRIQDVNSKACGLFCISFVKSVNSVNSYINFIHQFDHINQESNDYVLLQFI